MYRIIGANTIDLGGGRRGFRGKDTLAGVPGTELTARWHNDVQEEVAGLVEKAGMPLDEYDTTQLARAVRSFGLNHRIAGGTGNAISITLDPPVSDLDELLNVPLLIKASAVNTSADVTLSVDGLAAMPIKRLGGGKLNPGDLQWGCYYEIVWDGTQFQIISPIAAPATASTTRAPLLSTLTARTNGGINLATSAPALANYATVIQSTLGTSTWNGNTLTIGPGEEGLWFATASLVWPAPVGGFYTQQTIRRNGIDEVAGAQSTGNTGDASLVTAAGFIRTQVGDTLQAWAYQQSGSTRNSTGDARERCTFALISAY